MTSTSIQVSLLREEVDILEEEANRQMGAAVRKREEAIARGEKVGNLKQIAASTVATQIIRAALPTVEKRQTWDKKRERNEKGEKKGDRK
jgi:hypothetical protein